MPTSCNAKPQRGVTMVASRFNGWYKVAGYHCQMPTASLPKLQLIDIFVIFVNFDVENNKNEEKSKEK